MSDHRASRPELEAAFEHTGELGKVNILQAASYTCESFELELFLLGSLGKLKGERGKQGTYQQLMQQARSLERLRDAMAGESSSSGV